MKTIKPKHKVSIVMGSKSDYPTMQLCEDILKKLKLKIETNIISEHRTHDRMFKLANAAEANTITVVIVGADRISINGHVCNKIGTYLKALAAKANNIPFYVAAPSSTIDINFKDQINFDIENRSTDEILNIQGLDENKRLSSISLSKFNAHNPAFDVTPNHLISGIITEKGIFKPEDLKTVYA